MSYRVLSLYDRTGNWAEPYREMGYSVRCVDLQETGEDARLLEDIEPPDVILAAPPCTAFASSGARWWPKREDQVADALSNVDAVLRMVVVFKPAVWAIENPVGRLSRWLGPPRLVFHPWEFAGWADDPLSEVYTKRTCLWGNFRKPKKREAEDSEILEQRVHKAPDSKERANLRSITPTGFARAFAEANQVREVA